MHFANGAALAAVLFTTLTQNLSLCSLAEAGIVLKFSAKNEPRVLTKKVYILFILIEINCSSELF